MINMPYRRTGRTDKPLLEKPETYEKPDKFPNTVEAHVQEATNVLGSNQSALRRIPKGSVINYSYLDEIAYGGQVCSRICFEQRGTPGTPGLKIQGRNVIPETKKLGGKDYSFVYMTRLLSQDMVDEVANNVAKFLSKKGYTLESV